MTTENLAEAKKRYDSDPKFANNEFRVYGMLKGITRKERKQMVITLLGGIGGDIPLLIASGVNPSNIHVAELSYERGKHIKRKYPGVHVHNFCVTKLWSKLVQQGLTGHVSLDFEGYLKQSHDCDSILPWPKVTGRRKNMLTLDIVKCAIDSGFLVSNSILEITVMATRDETYCQHIGGICKIKPNASESDIIFHNRKYRPILLSHIVDRHYGMPNGARYTRHGVEWFQNYLGGKRKNIPMLTSLFKVV